MCNVSLIETACHLCGDVKAVGGTYSENLDSFHATAHLEAPDKRCEPFYIKVKTPKVYFDVLFKIRINKQTNYSFYRTVTISLRRFKESDGREKSIIFQLQDGTVLNLRPSKTPGAKPGTCQYTCMSMKVRGIMN